MAELPSHPQLCPPELLRRLRDNDPRTRVTAAPGSPAAALLDQWAAHGVRMAATGGPLEEVWHRPSPT